MDDTDPSSADSSVSMFESQFSVVPLWEIWSFTEHDRVSRLVEEMARLQEKLQEKVNINKPAAKFFKLSIGGARTQQASPSLTRLELRSEFEVHVPFVDELDDEVENALTAEFEVGTWRQDEVDWKLLQESVYLSRDTLAISREIAPFIRDCVKSSHQLPPLITLTESSRKQIDKYILEECSGGIYHHLDDEQNEEKTPKIPDLISLPRETDFDLISEDIEQASMSDELASVGASSKLAPLYHCHRYLISSVELSEAEPDGMIVSCKKWELEPLPINYGELQSREKYLLDEELTKGTEFRLVAPFMSEEPTFQEHKTPFEYFFTRVPVKLTIKLKSSNQLETWAKSLSEDQLVEENITPGEFEVFEVHTASPGKISPVEVFFLEVGRLCQHQQEYFEPPPNIKEPTTKSDDTTMKMACIQDSAVLIHEPNKTTMETTVDINSTSLAATRMQTKVDVTLPVEFETTKRSIDDELETLIRKRKKHFSKDDKSSRQPLLDLLRGGETGLDMTVAPTDATVVTDVFTEKITVFDQPRVDCDHTIGFNSTFIHKFQKHMNYLKSSTNLNVLELDMDANDVDFLMSAQTGVVILDVLDLDQCTVQGSLMIQEKILRAKEGFSTLVVVVIASELVKREVVAKFELAMALMDVECCVVPDDVEAVCDWLCEIAHTHGDMWPDQKAALIEQPEIEFLVACGLNPFMAVEILNRITIFEFACLDSNERDTLGLLTPQQSHDLDVLFSTQWCLG